LNKLLCILFFLMMGSDLLLAQTGGFAGEFTRMGFSPRGIAMGNAMSAVTASGSYAYYNPAMAVHNRETIQADIATAALQFDRKLHMAGINVQLPPMAGLSISLLNARVSNIDGRTTSGYHTEMLSVAEYQLIGNFAIRFSEILQAGVGIKYNHANFHSDMPASTGLGLDAGLLIRINPQINAAFVVKDILGSYEIDTSELYGTDQPINRNQSFPTRFIAGISWQILDSWHMAIDTEIKIFEAERLREETIEQNGFPVTVTRREEVSGHNAFIRTGTGYHIHERITLRSGLEWMDIAGENIFQPSFGFSIHLPFDTFSPSIDYAIRREPNRISSMHVFAIRLDI
jgi:hypothetical protein